MRGAASIVLVAVAVLVAAPASAEVRARQTKATTATASERTLDARIEHRFKTDSSLKKFDIKASVDHGVATLTGTVATEADRSKAAELAMVKGITRVDNRIVVDLDAGRKGIVGTIGEKAKEAGEKSKEGAEKVGGAAKKGVSKTGEVITDSWITGRVKTRFVGEDLLKGSDIHVETDKNVVTLTGTVMSKAGRAKAVQIARHTEGVHRVVDRLTIGAKKS